MRTMQTAHQENPHALKRINAAHDVAKIFAQVPGITSIAIIGSVATGAAHSDSDIDIVSTYLDPIDKQAFDAACEIAGRDPNGIVGSNDPLVSMTALSRENFQISFMLGPESHLNEMAHRAKRETPERYRQCLLSYCVFRRKLASRFG